MLSWIAASFFIVYILYVFYEQFKIPASNKDIVNISPKTTSFTNIIEDNCTEIFVIVKNMRKNKEIFIALDAAIKKGVYHIVKKLINLEFS